MSSFNRFYKREKLISKTLEIDEELYDKLEILSKNVYEASINKLVNAAIEDLIKNENVKFYKNERNAYVARSFLIRESFLEKLYDLKKKYRLPIYLIVNIAINNILNEEKIL